MIFKRTHLKTSSGLKGGIT